MPHHLLVLVGVPGSGKTTYARRLVARCPLMRLVSPDSIRDTLYPGYEQGLIEHHRINHRRIFNIAYRQVNEGLEHGQDVIFDATNLTASRRHALIGLARRHGAIAVAHYFPISITTAIHRNRTRMRRVPPGVIANMSRTLESPRETEGFARVVVHRQV